MFLTPMGDAFDFPSVELVCCIGETSVTGFADSGALHRQRTGRTALTAAVPGACTRCSAASGVRLYAPRMRDIETTDSELRLVTALRRAARERGGPLPSTAPMGRAAQRAPSAPLPHQRESGNRRSAVARTQPHRTRDTSMWYVHRDTCCTAGARRASRPAASGDRAGSSAAAASSTSHRCRGQERRLRA
jgi:hypothetical protein